MHTHPIRDWIEVESEAATRQRRRERRRCDRRRGASQCVERVDAAGRAECVETAVDRPKVDALNAFTGRQPADRHLAGDQIGTQRAECDQ